MDVRSVEDNQALINAAVEKFGKLDSIVPNAGIGIYGSMLDHTDDELRRMMHTNYDGTVWTVRAGVPAMLKTTGSGDIVIVSSVAGLRGGGDEAVYAGTKFAQVGPAGAGRVEKDPRFANWMKADDVTHALVSVLQQPRSVRTTVGQLWSMGQQS